MTTLQGERDSLRARMADIEAEADKLKRQLGDLQGDRDRIAFALSILDRIDSGTSADGAALGRPGGKVVDLSPGRRREPGMRPASRRIGATTQHLLSALRSIGEPADVETIIPAMRAHGWAAEPKNEVETVRAALSRTVRDGMVVRLAVGTYGLPEWGDEPAPPSDDAAADAPGDEALDERPDDATGEPDYDDEDHAWQKPIEF